MSDRKKHTRAAPISYRPPKGLQDEFRRRAEKSGLSLSAFITASVFGNDAPRASRKPSVEKRDLAKLLSSCAAIHDELSRFDLGGKDDGEIVARLDAAHRELSELRAACFKALGRTP